MTADPNDSSRPVDSHPDPITDEPGAHPLGTGVGAAVGGMAAGAAVGTVVGPVGTVIGAAVGAIAGGLAGKGIAELIDPSAEDAYWREHYASRPYVGSSGSSGSYSDYGPAYNYGVDAFRRDPGRIFSEGDAEWERGWEQWRGGSQLDWERARPAVRDAWQRLSDGVERTTPGDRDRDGL